MMILLVRAERNTARHPRSEHVYTRASARATGGLPRRLLEARGAPSPGARCRPRRSFRRSPRAGAADKKFDDDVGRNEARGMRTQVTSSFPGVLGPAALAARAAQL